MPDAPLPCCPDGTAVHERDLDHVHGFDFDLFACERCGSPWIWAWYAGRGGWEPVTPADAERMRALAPEEVRGFMRTWARDFD